MNRNKNFLRKWYFNDFINLNFRKVSSQWISSCKIFHKTFYLTKNLITVQSIYLLESSFYFFSTVSHFFFENFSWLRILRDEGRVLLAAKYIEASGGGSSKNRISFCDRYWLLLSRPRQFSFPAQRIVSLRRTREMSHIRNTKSILE